MLEYAYLQGTNDLVNINQVPNGIKCNCVCPDCGDVLVAKNQGEHVSSHFSHHTREEKLSCLMTQLHRVAQHFFLSASSIKLPVVAFNYKGHQLTCEEREVTIHSARLEKKVGKYFADVFLDTDIGEIAIEILVTHKTERDKARYYRDSKLPSIEYDLSAYKSIEIQLCIDALKKNHIRHDWLYEWCREALIAEHEAQLENQRRDLQKRRIRSARTAANRLIKDKYVILPSIKAQLTHEIGDRSFAKEVDLFTKKDRPLDEIGFVDETDDYLLLRGVLKGRYIWIVFLLTDSIPKYINQLDGSIVARYPAPDVGKKAVWKWLKHPSNDKIYATELEGFKLDCQSQINLEANTRLAEDRAVSISDDYVNSEDFYFKSDYKIWKRWMIQNELFTPNAHKPNPSLPSTLKYLGNYPALWVFNTWHILALSKLAEIIDREPIGEPIKYLSIFYDLGKEFGVHPEFYDIEKMVHPLQIQQDYKPLILRRSIIREILEPFFIEMKVVLKDDHFIRKESLTETLRIN